MAASPPTPAPQLTVRDVGGSAAVFETTVPLAPAYAAAVPATGYWALRRGTVQVFATGPTTTTAVLVALLQPAAADAGPAVPDPANDGAVLASGGASPAVPLSGAPTTPTATGTFSALAWAAGAPPAWLPLRTANAVAQGSLVPVTATTARLRLLVVAP